MKTHDNQNKATPQNSDILQYDRETAQKWKDFFDVYSPQECANLFQKPVQDENTVYYPQPPAPLRVCEHCLMAIESREGRQITRKIYLDDDDLTPCDWCEDIGHTELYEIY